MDKKTEGYPIYRLKISEIPAGHVREAQCEEIGGYKYFEKQESNNVLEPWLEDAVKTEGYFIIAIYQGSGRHLECSISFGPLDYLSSGLHYGLSYVPNNTSRLGERPKKFDARRSSLSISLDYMDLIRPATNARYSSEGEWISKLVESNSLNNN